MMKVENDHFSRKFCLLTLVCANSVVVPLWSVSIVMNKSFKGMKISFETKILLGFIVNLIVVIASGWIFIAHLEEHGGRPQYSVFNWVELALFVLSIVLLIVVYFIIRTQLRAKHISEELLIENKKLLQSILDNTSNPVFIKKLNGEYLFVNKQYGALFQIASDKIIGKTDHDFLPKETADTYRDSDLEVVKALKELKIEETITQWDGPHTYIASKFPLYDSTGRVYAIGGISIDISERKKAEESIKAGDKFFNMSLDIMVIASKEKFLKINPTMSKILGYSNEELLSQSFFKFIYADDIEITKKEIGKLLTGEHTIKFENRWICKDGSIKLLSWTAASDMATGLLYAIASDVTKSKEIEKSLINSEKFFNMASDIFLLAKGENIIKINPAVTRIFGFKLSDLENKSILTFVHPDDLKSFAEEFKKLQSGIPRINVRARSISKDGTYKWIVWSSTSDPLTGTIFAAGRDITDLIENEKSLLYSEKFFNMSNDIFFLAKGKNVIKINPATIRILGFELKDYENKSFLDFVHPDDVAATAEAIKKLDSGTTVIKNLRTRSRCKDGSYKVIVWSVTSDLETGVLFAAGRDISDLIEKEESLKIANSFFEMSFDPFVVTKGNQVIKINPAVSKILGYHQSDLTKSFLDYIHSDYQKIATERIANLAKGLEMESHFEYPILSKSGSYKWMEIMISIDINMGMNYIVLKDKTQKKIDEDKINAYTQKLKDNEQQLKTIFDGAPDPVIVIDEESKIVRWNPKAESFFGWKETEVIGRPLTEFIIPSQYREEHKKGMEKFKATGIGPILNKTTEMEALSKEGKEFPVALSISPAKIGEKNVFIGFVRDITETKKVINDLYENEKTLQLILENIAEGVVVADADKKIIMTNLVAENFFGIKENEQRIASDIIDRFEVFYPDGKTIFPAQNLPIESAFNGEAVDDIDVVLFDTISKEKRRVLMSGRPLVNQENKVVAAVVTIKDISKYKQMEAELKETESKYRQLIGFKTGGNVPV